MKITDALISVLRLLVTTDDDRVEPAADRPVPDWVKRVNGGLEADPPHEATSASPTFASSIAPETDPEHEMVEPVQNAVEPEQNVEDEQAVEEEEAVEEAQAVEEEQAVPALLDSLLSWVQARDDEPAPVARIEPEPELELAREPEPAHEFEPEPEPVPEAVSLPPEPVGAATAVSPAVVPVAPDLARLEASAQVAESLNLGFHLGSAVERIASAAAQGSDGAASLREAVWLIERYISIIENRPLGADLHLTAARLARAGDAIAGLKALAETLGETEPEPRPA